MRLPRPGLTPPSGVRSGLDSTDAGSTDAGSTDTAPATRAAQPNGLGVTATRTRGAIMKAMQTDAAEFGTPRDAMEFARLSILAAALLAALDSADRDVAEEGHAKLAAITADESA